MLDYLIFFTNLYFYFFKILNTMKTKFFERVKWLKRNVKLLVLLLVVLFLLFISCSLPDGGGAQLAMALVTGVAGGKHVVDGPLTTDVTREAAPELLLNEIDRQIVKIRPMATPVDQLSRCAGSKHAGSMIVDYHNVDTKPTSAKLRTSYVAPATEDDVDSDASRVKLYTDNDNIFDATDTILVQGVSGYNADGTLSSNELVLYVTSRDEEGGIYAMPVNGKKIGDLENCMPSLSSGTTLIRMGRAASELDVMSPQFESLPQKARQFCQIFKMQIEQSTLQKLSNKEVPWTMSDQEEAAIYDMRLGMEKSFLFGVKNRIWDPIKKENVMFTGGIWHQAGKTFNYDEDSLTQESVIDMMREAFTGNAGSKRKILLGGSGLIGSLNKLNYTKVVTAAESVTKWGIDFNQLRSKFGTLYVLLSEIFDEVGMADNGLIIDPQYLQKYSHIPFTTESLDVKKSGVRNVDALVLTEASCLVLRYPKAHMRIVMQ